MKRRMSIGDSVRTRRMAVDPNIAHESVEEPSKKKERPVTYNKRPSDSVKKQVLAKRLEGLTRKEIGEELGLDPSYVSNILYHDSYKDLRLSMGFEK